MVASSCQPYARCRSWLAGAPVLDGRRPRSLRVPGTDPLLEGLYDEAPGDPARARLLGARTSLTEVLAEEPEDVLERLADPARTVGRTQPRAVYAALADTFSGGDLPQLAASHGVSPAIRGRSPQEELGFGLREQVDPPARVRAVVDGGLQVVPAEDAVVVDRPDLLARITPYAVVQVPLSLASALAEVLDLDLASEVIADAELPTGGVTSWTDSWPNVPGQLRRHDRLTVPDAGGNLVDVDWARVGDLDHVRGDEGTARALAWRLGAWDRRHELLVRLRGDGGDADTDLDMV